MVPLGGSGAEWGAPPLVYLAWYGVGIGHDISVLRERRRCVTGVSLIGPPALCSDTPHYHLMDGTGSGVPADCGIPY